MERAARKEERPVGPDGRPIGRAPVDREDEPSLILLTYSAVDLNPELTPEQFAFEPPSDVRTENSTDQLLAGLDEMLNGRALAKKNEAAKAGAELPQSIAVPKPAPDANPTAPAVEPLKPSSSVPKG
jgi:hypothetical protein